MADIYIGLMSGTSLDGFDAVAVAFTPTDIKVLETCNLDMPEELGRNILQLCYPGFDEINLLAEIESEIAHTCARAVKELLSKASLNPEQVRAIGCHGQTVRHLPEKGFTLQAGDPSLLAELTGISVVADFRRRDMAAGGEGAPLVPAFHYYVFNRVPGNNLVVNIGGISNITVLPDAKDQPVTGFDTGPGNLLMDYWCLKHTGQSYDDGGQWAASARADSKLLKTLLSDPFFSKAPPKSTGRELFSPQWLDFMLEEFGHLSPPEVQATLCKLTATCIARAIQEHASDTDRVFCCGGGANNQTLMKMLAAELPDISVTTTAEAGVDPQWMEAIAFAWLARQAIHRQPGNLPAVTGAKGPRILGGIYPA